MSIGEEVRSAVVNTIKAGGDVGSALVNAIAQITETALKDAEEIGKEAIAIPEEIIVEGIKAAGEIGNTGVDTIQYITSGVVTAISTSTVDTEEGISRVVGKAINTTHQAGGNVGATAVSAVRGAIDAAKKSGVDVDQAAEAAIRGALKGAKNIGADAVDAVAKDLSEGVVGIREIVKKVFGQ
jgi:hypothetical protein